MLTGPDSTAGPLRVAARWRPFGGAIRPAWVAGRVRALREAEDDAQTVLAFLLTGLTTHAIDPAEVVWVIDLAPGEGERAWRVLKALSGRAPRAAPIRYLACCASAEHQARLLAHPLLRPLIRDGSMTIDREGRGVPRELLRNPIVVLAHEGLSSQSQGLYTARSGELLEAWSDGENAIDWRATTRRDGVMRLLSTYRQSLDGAAFTLPRGAMDTLSALLRASGGRMLLRASDQGAMGLAQIRMGVLALGNGDAGGRDAGHVLRVNFEALARWHRANGASIHQTQRDDDGRVLHIALHDIAGGRLQECLPEVLGLPHPDDHVELLLAMQALSTVSPVQCLALLHSQAGDPRALLALSRHMRQSASSLEGAALTQWREMLTYCVAQHYPHADCDAKGEGEWKCDEIPALIADLAMGMHDAFLQRTALAAYPLASNKDSPA